MHVSIGSALDFLVQLYNAGLDYSALTQLGVVCPPCLIQPVEDHLAIICWSHASSAECTI